MHSPAAAHASTAAEAIRALNHATLPGRDGLTEPADAYEVLANLSSLAERLTQAIGQVQFFLDQQNADGDIRIVDGEHRDDPRAAVDTCRQLTHTAIAGATRLATVLHKAQETLTWAAAAISDRRHDLDVLELAHNDVADLRSFAESGTRSIQPG